MDKFTKRINVRLSAAEAFSRFTNDINRWWPKAYTWSGDLLKEVRIDAKVGGFCYEIGPHDFRVDWGRVIDLEPDRMIRFTWQINSNRVPEPNPKKSSEVTVSFRELEESLTEVSVEHRNFLQHGPGWIEYLQAMDSSGGWMYLLECFRENCDEPS